MNLREKFFNLKIIVIGCSNNSNPCVIEQSLTESVAEQCKTICDDFAIGFAEWVDNKTVQISKGEWANWQEDAKSCLTSKELLQIYKDIQK